MNAESSQRQPTILLTGGTGYIGGRLLGIFEQKGTPVRCLARRPEYLRSRVKATTEVVEGDLLEPDSLAGAFDGIETAYFLVHSMGSEDDFEEKERRAAENFADAAKKAGVSKIIYLGGLGKGDDLSPHLASRQMVGTVLRESGVPTIEFRASIIIGSGSVSFELFRSLVERLPVMTTPRWVRSTAQPIAVEDVLAYLTEAAGLDIDESEIVEIGGADRVSYEDMMQEYARQRGLRRIIIPVPVLSPNVSSLWLGLVTPVYARVGKKLIEGLRHNTVVESNRANELFTIRPRGIREAIQRALNNEDREFAATRWSDALSSVGSPPRFGGVQFGQRLIDSRSLKVRATPEDAFAPIQRIGGDTGWYYGNWLWRIRGYLDVLAGGAGLRRGRRSGDQILPGETIDFWRVEDYQPGQLLRLHAEMKVPGRAWLQFEVEEIEGGSRIRQTAMYDPVGITGLLYWYALYPVHRLVFANMLKGIAREIPKLRKSTVTAAA